MKELRPASKSRRVKAGLVPAWQEVRKDLGNLMSVVQTALEFRDLNNAGATIVTFEKMPNGHWRASY